MLYVNYAYLYLSLSTINYCNQYNSIMIQFYVKKVFEIYFIFNKNGLSHDC